VGPACVVALSQHGPLSVLRSVCPGRSSAMHEAHVVTVVRCYRAEALWHCMPRAALLYTVCGAVS